MAGRAEYFTLVALKNWRTYARACVELGPYTFVAGPCGAGKSHLLDAFRFIRDLSEAGGDVTGALQRRGGLSRVRSLVARKDSRVGLLIRAGMPGNASKWEYSIELEAGPEGRARIYRERLCLDGKAVVERPTDIDVEDAERLGYSVLGGGMLHREVRGWIELLRSVRFINPIPFLLRDRMSEQGREWEEYGAGLFRRMAQTPDRFREARLRLILEELRRAGLGFGRLQVEEGGGGEAHLRVLAEHWRSRGAWQTEREIGDGHLRSMAILWEILSGGGPLFIEEPENSLDSVTAAKVSGMITRLSRRASRQVVVVTHSAELVRSAGVKAGQLVLVIPRREGSALRRASSKDEALKVLSGGELEDAWAQAEQPQLELFETSEEQAQKSLPLRR